VRSLAAFDKSEYADDWRDLMRLYLVRRTRSFIQENYAKYDAERKRKYLEFHDGTRSYFPTRVPRTVKFKISEKDPNDPYARLFTDDVVDIVDGLVLPRYGLGNYVKPTPHKPPTTEEAKVLSDLSRAGTRLKGFCRTNLFKRLESSGQAFILSVERHILRNFICLHAIENDLPIPIGTQDIGLLDAWANDQDTDLWDAATDNDENNDSTNDPTENMAQVTTEQKFKEQASEIYDTYAKHFQRRFKWLKPEVFNDALAKDLRKDVKALMNVLKKAGGWDPKLDTKLQELLTLLTKSHTKDKVIVFSQFADTVNYLAAQIKAAGLQSMEGVTGDTEDPTAIRTPFQPCQQRQKQTD